MDIPDVIEPLDEKYCHCLWEVRAKSPNYNPYAVCSASIYTHHGLVGPGPIKCVVDRGFIESLPTEALLSFLESKYHHPVNVRDRSQLLAMVFDELKARGELVDRPDQLPLNERPIMRTKTKSMLS